MRALQYQECTQCGSRRSETVAICPHCWGATFMQGESSGEGTIYTATRVFVSLPDDRWKSIVPYDVLIVDLDDGFQLLGRAHLSVPIESAPGVRVRGTLREGVPIFEQVKSG